MDFYGRESGEGGFSFRSINQWRRRHGRGGGGGPGRKIFQSDSTPPLSAPPSQSKKRAPKASGRGGELGFKGALGQKGEIERVEQDRTEERDAHSPRVF